MGSLFQKNIGESMRDINGRVIKDPDIVNWLTAVKELGPTFQVCTLPEHLKQGPSILRLKNRGMIRIKSYKYIKGSRSQPRAVWEVIAC